MESQNVLWLLKISLNSHLLSHHPFDDATEQLTIQSNYSDNVAAWLTTQLPKANVKSSLHKTLDMILKMDKKGQKKEDTYYYKTS